MQGQEFIYFLTDRLGPNPQFWGLDDNGNVRLSGKPYMLDFSPEGWLDLSVQNIRNRKYWAVDRSVTIPFGYIEDGAKILKTIFYKFGPEQPVYLKVCRQMLDFEPNPVGDIVFSADQNPITPNGTAAGTITAPPGSTVHIKVSITDPGVSDSLVGYFDTGTLANFNVNSITPVAIVPVITPASGIISFSAHFTRVSGSTATARLDVVNAAGNASGSFGFWYKQTFVGQVEMPGLQHKGAKVTVSTIEDGLPKYLKANESTTFELAMNVPEAVLVAMDGIRLHQKANFLVSNGAVYPENGNHTVQLDIMSREGVSLNIKDVPRAQLGGSSGLEQNANMANGKLWFHYSSTGEPIEVEWDFEMTAELASGIPPNPVVQLALVARNLADDGTVIQSTTLQQFNTPTNVYRKNHFVGSASIPVQINSGLYLFMGINIIGSSGDRAVYFHYEDGGKFNITKSIYRKATTYVRALTPQYIFERLMALMTEDNYSADPGDGVNNYFGSARYANRVFTCGNALRGFDDATIKISWNDFFNFWDSFDSVGITTKGRKVRLDRKKNLVNFAKSIHLGSAYDLAVTLDKSFSFNDLAVGYPEISNEIGALNGNESFNCSFLFSSGSSLSPARLDKIAKFPTDCYQIENDRIVTADKSTTDYKNDNTVYPLHISLNFIPEALGVPGHYNLDRSLNPFATGLIEPETVFNLDFSPKRNFLRAGDYYRSCLYKQDWRVFKYVSSDKNNKLITTRPIAGGATEVIEEKQSVLLGELPDPFFHPVLIDGMCQTNGDLLELLDEDPLQLVDIEFYGKLYFGILIKAALAPGSDKDQEFQMLSIPANDLSQLIDYYG